MTFLLPIADKYRWQGYLLKMIISKPHIFCLKLILKFFRELLKIDLEQKLITKK